MSKYNRKHYLLNKLDKAKVNKDEQLITYYGKLIASRASKKVFRRTKFKPKSKPTTKYSDPLKLAIKRQEDLLLNPTIPETYFRGLLDVNNIPYQFQHIIFTSSTQFYILDFYIPHLRICIELDGWHHINKPKQAEHDRLRDEALKATNIKTIRLSNTKGLAMGKDDIKPLLENI